MNLTARLSVSVYQLFFSKWLGRQTSKLFIEWLEVQMGSFCLCNCKMILLALITSSLPLLHPQIFIYRNELI
jgi:hypothetical protein